MKSLPFAVMAALVVAAPAAHGSVIATLSSVSSVGSDYNFSYVGQLAPDQGVTAGDKLVIVDFNGYVPGTVASALADVFASVSNTLPAGMLLPPGVTDNPLIPDLVFTYTGPDYHTQGGPYGSDTNFSGLSAESRFGGITRGSFSAVAVKNNGLEAGTAAYNVGSVGVPGGVPEPASWTLMLLGVAAIGSGLRMARGQCGATFHQA